MTGTVAREVRASARAWWVAAATMAALVAAAGFRSSTGALLEPLEDEFGWSRGVTSGAVIRRTVPAMAVTLAVFVAVQILTPSLVRAHLGP